VLPGKPSFAMNKFFECAGALKLLCVCLIVPLIVGFVTYARKPRVISFTPNPSAGVDPDVFKTEWSNKYLAILENVMTGSIYPHVVELGVWRGGTLLFAKAVLDVLGAHERNVVGVDAFETITGYGNSQNYLSVELSFVVDLFKRFNMYDSSVVLIKGMFREALPELRKQFIVNGRHISVLRMDGNYYDSHMETFFNLYEFVPVGGFVIFDDWCFSVVQQAWSDFAQLFGSPETPSWIHNPDDTNGAYFVKRRAVNVDATKMPPARDVSKA